MRRLIATVPTDFKSDLLNIEATEIADNIYVAFATNKDLVSNILFEDGSKFLEFVSSMHIQPLVDDYVQNNQDYDAGQLEEETTNLKYAIYNIICNKLEAMNVKDLLTYIGITLIRK